MMKNDLKANQENKQTPGKSRKRGKKTYDNRTKAGKNKVEVENNREDQNPSSKKSRSLKKRKNKQMNIKTIKPLKTSEEMKKENARLEKEILLDLNAIQEINLE